jgi:hypothetical protein
MTSWRRDVTSWTIATRVTSYAFTPGFRIFNQISNRTHRVWDIGIYVMTSWLMTSWRRDVTSCNIATIVRSCALTPWFRIFNQISNRTHRSWDTGIYAITSWLMTSWRRDVTSCNVETILRSCVLTPGCRIFNQILNRTHRSWGIDIYVITSWLMTSWRRDVTSCNVETILGSCALAPGFGIFNQISNRTHRSWDIDIYVMTTSWRHDDVIKLQRRDDSQSVRIDSRNQNLQSELEYDA